MIYIIELHGLVEHIQLYRCRTNLGNTSSSINAHRSLLLLTTTAKAAVAAARGNTTYALATQQYELCASSMGRGE